MTRPSMRLSAAALTAAAAAVLGGFGLASESGAATEVNVVANPSFELDLHGWGGWQARLSKVTVSGASGLSAARVRRSTGTAYAIDDAPASMPTATAGAVVTARAAVRSSSSSSIGKPIEIVLRERAPTGALVDQTKGTALLTAAFADVSTQLTVSATGNTVDVYVGQLRAERGDAFLVDAVSMVAAVATPPAPAPAPPPVPVPTGVVPFSPASPFNVPLSPSAALDPNNTEKSAALLGAGPRVLNLNSWSPAVYVGTPSDPEYTVQLSNVGTWGPNTLNGKKVRVPAGAKAPADVTSGVAPDNHVTIVSDGVAHSLWQTQSPANGVIHATWGGMARLDGIGSNMPGSTGGRGAGVSQLAGLITPEDVASGDIRHALAVSVQGSLVSTGWLSPAVKTDGQATPSSRTVKEGQRIRLAADTDLSAITHPDPKAQAFARMVAKALRDYGAIVIDRTGAGMGFYMQNPISYTSLGKADPWPALVGSAVGASNFSAVLRDTNFPWTRLQVLSES